MHEFLYRDRTHLAVYALAMYRLAVEKLQDREKLATDPAKHRPVPPAGRREPDGLAEPAARQLVVVLVRKRVRGPSLLPEAPCQDDPEGEVARRLVKYLLNNRKHATYWNSTRDTAVVVEAFADFLKASGEAKPEMTVEVWYDGQLQKAVEITARHALHLR